MCYGCVTELRCPHKLVHFKTRCPSKCDLPDGPRYFLEDTCAACHPSYRLYLIEIKYEPVRDQLASQLHAATQEGRTDEVADLTRRLERTSALKYLEVCEAQSVRAAMEGVLWPGKVEE